MTTLLTQKEDDEDYPNEFIDDEGIEESDWADYREGVLRTEYGDERYEEEGPKNCPNYTDTKMKIGQESMLMNTEAETLENIPET